MSLRYLTAFAAAAAVHVALLFWAPGAQALAPAKRVSLTLVQPPPKPQAQPVPEPPRTRPPFRRMAAASPRPAAAPPVLTAPVTVESPTAPALAEGSMDVATPVAPAPAVAPVQAPVTQATEAIDPGAFEDYRGSVHGRVAGFKRYPLQARRMHIEGVTTVVFRIRRDGSLACPPQVIGSSHPLLDAEAVRMVQAAAPFAPLPRGTQDVEEFRVSIHFSLSS